MSSAAVDATRRIIESNRYLALSTTDHEKPWVAALAYAVDVDYTFYVYSAKNSLHATHLKSNPKVAFTIFNSTLPSEEVDGIQVAGTAKQVSLLQLPKVLEMYYQQLFTDVLIREQWRQPISAFQKLAVKRFYQITPLTIYKLDLSIIEVDVRIEIDLPMLRQVPPSRSF